MKISPLLTKVSVAATAVPLLVSSIFIEEAKAEMFRPVFAGQEDWVRVTFKEGKHSIFANSPRAMGNVDISLYDSSGQCLLSSNNFGPDWLNFTVRRRGTFYVKYRMASCFNPFGPCKVSLKFF